MFDSNRLRAVQGYIAATLKRIWPNLEGDITGNGIVDMVDLKALVFHWTQTCE